MAAKRGSYAAQLIQLANSPISAPLKPITSLESSIERLGVNTIANLVTSMAVTRIFVPAEPTQQRLWVHAIQVAFGACTIAKESPSMSQYQLVKKHNALHAV
jgi:HD-like signal output (HDOD) protein